MARIRALRMKSCIAISVVIGLWLQLIAIGSLAGGHVGSYMPLLVLFGPSAIFMPISLFVGFVIYPIYLYTLAHSVRVLRTTMIILTIHFGTVALGASIIWSSSQKYADDIDNLSRSLRATLAQSPETIVISSIALMTLFGLMSWYVWRCSQDVSRLFESDAES